MTLRLRALGLALLLFCVGCGPTIQESLVDAASREESADAGFSASYFGMNISSPHQIAWPSVPFGTLRLWDSDVTWLQLEPQRGVWQFSRLDAMISVAQKHNVEVLLPLALSPAWASSNTTNLCVYNSYGCTAAPALIQDWKAYVDTVVRRYKGRIHYYEVWNEVNLAEFWTGTPQQLVQLQQVAFEEIKSIDPAAQVLAPSFVGASIAKDSFLSSALQLGLANYADIMNYHLYVTPNEPELIAERGQEFKSFLAGYNIHKPVWNTETNWIPPFTLSEKLGAAYLMRALLAGTASGSARFFWYQWDNHCCVSIQLTRSDNKTPTEAAQAFQLLETWLTGNQLEPCTATHFGMWTCGLRFPNGHRGEIVWAPGKSLRLEHVPGWTPKSVHYMTGDSLFWTESGVTVNDYPAMIEGE